MTDVGPSVAAVVLNWRDVPRTTACVRQLLQDPLVTSVWAVDNESTGELAQALGSLGSDLVHTIASGDNLGFSAGMNLGLGQAIEAADLVLCLNNDLTIGSEDVALLVSRMRADPGLSMVAPTIENADGSVSSGGTFHPWTFDTREEPGTRSPDYLTWACVLLRSDVLRRTGLLDERYFMYWEDVEFAHRLRAGGRGFALVPEARAFHEVSASHSRSGGWVECYSAYGVVVLGRALGGRARVGSWLRVGARVGKSLTRRDLRRARLQLLGARLALSRSARRGVAAHEVVAAHRRRAGALR